MKLSIAPNVHLVEPGDFEPTQHWYPRVINSNIHPLVGHFMNLSNEQIAERYARLNPGTKSKDVLQFLSYEPTYFKWSGTDIMHISNRSGERKLTIIETNSCPSGQKSMPLLDLNIEKGGYKRLIEQTFKPMVLKDNGIGCLAVIYDKNPMENIGYASTIADTFNENVYLVKFENKAKHSAAKFINNKLWIDGGEDGWLPVKAAFRYVTQEPWNRIPTKSETILLNPIEACLAGGRNKTEAYKAYMAFNKTFVNNNLSIQTPTTFLDVSFDQIADHFELLGGSMVIKVPDSNAGQGVYTITSEEELSKTLETLTPMADQLFIVQQLIFANYIDGADPRKAWYHVGTIPDKKGRSFAFDIRMMIHHTNDGLRPLAVYSRRARMPLNEPLAPHQDSWEMYGTNLSVKEADGWSYEDERLILYDIRNFGALGLGIDELIQAFVQSTMATYAIDQHALNSFGKSRDEE